MIRAQSLCAIAALLVLLSCASSSESVESTAQTPSPSTQQAVERAAADQPTVAAEAVEGDPQLGAASWAVVDGVPAYRKPGLLIKAGLNYEPVLDSGGVQTSSRLIVEAERGMFALALATPGDDSFDQIQLQVNEHADSALAAFVVTQDQQIFIFEEDGVDHCATWDISEPFLRYGLEDDLDGIFLDLEPRCAPLIELPDTDITVGSLPQTAQHAVAIGVLIDAVAPPQSDRRVEVGWLALADSSKPFDSAVTSTVTVRPLHLDRSIAFRSADPTDDQMLGTLSVLEFGTGTITEVALATSGVFEIDGSALGSDIVQISMSDYGEQYFPSQGPWIDLRRLNTEFVIDLAPAWEVTPGAPPDSSRIGRPHRLSIWNGSTSMDGHEYRGLTFTNNLGRADRDRLESNPNECQRIAYLGGSWVEALQTRVDQKPGIIAEAILDSQGEGCYEIFTDGRDTFTVENHYATAVDLVETYGVEVLIFSISAIELCRMDDEIVLNRFGKALETPPRWRLIDGQMVAPVSRGSAIDIDIDPEFDAAAHCTFQPGHTDVEAEVIEKLGELQSIYESLGSDVEVRFVNVRDPFIGTDDVAAHISELCEASGLVCQRAEIPLELTKPDEVDDYSPYLYRYLQDAHPNIRANQAIARFLVDVITDQQ